MLRTKVIDGPLALSAHRLAAARNRETGLQIMTLPQLAARLAGGFVQPAGGPILAGAIQSALSTTPLVDLAPLAGLPGMVRAVQRSLDRLWREAAVPPLDADHPRLRDMALLDANVRQALPLGILALPDLVAAAEARLALAPRLLGPVTLCRTREPDPLWRSLLAGLAELVEVTIEPLPIGADLAPPTLFACADPRSEAVEALRWARGLLANGLARPADIAIVAASPKAWDDHLMAMSHAASLPLHFSHGVPVLTTRPGQACAALFDILERGLSQERVRRVLAHGGTEAEGLRPVPPTPLAGVAKDAILDELGQWRHALALARAKRDDPVDIGAVLMPVLTLLAGGCANAVEAGQLLLPRAARTLWNNLLLTTPPKGIGLALANLRVADDRDPTTSIVWAPADHLIGAPRLWVRMLGLTATAWPRPIASDPLLPEHILRLEMGADQRTERDRQAFAVIGRDATAGLVLSYGRRGRQGARQALSPLVPRTIVPKILTRSRCPEQAFSEADRLRTRAAEAAAMPALARAHQCWRARRATPLSAHDGLIRANHPLIVAALGVPQSATSLRRLLRDPLGYVWHHVLGWRGAVSAARPFTLEPRAFGDLVHVLLQQTVISLEAGPGFARAEEGDKERALEVAARLIGETWPAERPTPPPLLWHHTLAQARTMALKALTLDPALAADTRSWTEVAFGSASAAESTVPWPGDASIPLTGTEITLRGAIDRLELTADDRARVTDYKTGTPPKNPEQLILGCGIELQRVIYAHAVRHHRPTARIQTRLVFLNDDEPQPHVLKGEALGQATEKVVSYVNAATALLANGICLPGPDAREAWSSSRLTLPADDEHYHATKSQMLARALTPLSGLWRER